MSPGWFSVENPGLELFNRNLCHLWKFWYRDPHVALHKVTISKMVCL